MDFENIHSDCECNCIDNATEDTVSVWAFKTNKTFLRPADFKTKWEKEDRDALDCKAICGKKGLSMCIFNEENKDEVIEIYKKLFPLSPSYRPNLTLVRMRAGCGVHKHTPRPHNQHHFDFYKCDAFKIENIIFLDSKAIA